MGKKKKPESPLEVEVEDESPVESPTDELNSFMASMSFRPREAHDKKTLEYAKAYMDPSDRVARAVAVIHKDDVGLEPSTPAYFTITIQFHVSASEEEVEKKAPVFCRQDLLHILSKFDEINLRNDLVIESCESCGMPSADFIDVRGKMNCIDCSRRLGI